MNRANPEQLTSLRSAYPLGCLPLRGVTTFGGFTCIEEILEFAGWYFVRGRVGYGGRFSSCIVKVNDTPEHVRGLAGMVGESDDDLLPDLTDRATFALALVEMAEALGWKDIDKMNLIWHQCLGGAWELLGTPMAFPNSSGTEPAPGVQKDWSYYVGTDDPIEAFLVARASLRGAL